MTSSMPIPRFQLTAAQRRLRVIRLRQLMDTSMFQLTAAQRRLHILVNPLNSEAWFQLTAAQRRLRQHRRAQVAVDEFQLTAAQRRLLQRLDAEVGDKAVSTHSRPKAAACDVHADVVCFSCFNSQPPKGGCNDHYR